MISSLFSLAGKWIGSAARSYRAAVYGPYSLNSTELSDFLGGEESESGVDVTAERAMQLSTVYACIQVLSQSLAQLPLYLYRRETNGKERIIKDEKNPLYKIAHANVNPQLTSYQFRQMGQTHLGYDGNFYAYIERDRADRIRALWPWAPSYVRVEADGWNLKYFLQVKGGQEKEIDSRNMLHIRGLSLNGLMGVSPLTAARETFASGIAAQRYGSKLWKKGYLSPYVLQTDKTMSDENAKKLGKSFVEAFGGVDKAHRRIAVLTDGVKMEKVGISPQDAQFLETRKFSREEIAAIYRVPSHMINNLDHATFSNIENQSLSFVIYTLYPWIKNWEQQLDLDLLSESEREEYYFSFNVDGLLRGDINSRWMAYRSGINWGVLSPDEVRALENMNPRPGGDQFLMPGNMVPSNQWSLETKNQNNESMVISMRDIQEFINSRKGPARAPVNGTDNRILNANGTAYHA